MHVSGRVRLRRRREGGVVEFPCRSGRRWPRQLRVGVIERANLSVRSPTLEAGSGGAQGHRGEMRFVLLEKEAGTELVRERLVLDEALARSALDGLSIQLHRAPRIPGEARTLGQHQALLVAEVLGAMLRPRRELRGEVLELSRRRLANFCRGGQGEGGIERVLRGRDHAEDASLDALGAFLGAAARRLVITKEIRRLQSSDPILPERCLVSLRLFQEARLLEVAVVEARCWCRSHESARELSKR